MLFLDFLSTNILWLLLLLLFFNFIAIAIIRSEERFWLLQVSVWVILFITLVLFNSQNSSTLEKNELVLMEQQQTAKEETKGLALLQLNTEKRKSREQNIAHIRLTGFQSFFCFLCMLLGYRLTNKKYFKSGAVTFFFLSVIYLLIEIIYLIPKSSTVEMLQ